MHSQRRRWERENEKKREKRRRWERENEDYFLIFRAPKFVGSDS
jgi:hypothetical protein